MVRIAVSPLTRRAVNWAMRRRYPCAREYGLLLPGTKIRKAGQPMPYRLAFPTKRIAEQKIVPGTYGEFPHTFLAIMRICLFRLFFCPKVGRCKYNLTVKNGLRSYNQNFILERKRVF